LEIDGWVSGSRLRRLNVWVSGSRIRRWMVGFLVPGLGVG